MARKVGFGDNPPSSGGGGFWAVLIGLGLIWFALSQLTGWRPTSPGPWWLAGLGVAALAAVAWRSGAFRSSRRVDPDRPREKPAGRPARARRADPEEDPLDDLVSEPVSPGGWVGVIFLSFWLCGWSAGIVMATSILIGELRDGIFGPHLFLVVWIGFALVGWVFAARLLMAMVRGLSGR